MSRDPDRAKHWHFVLTWETSDGRKVQVPSKAFTLAEANKRAEKWRRTCPDVRVYHRDVINARNLSQVSTKAR